MKQREGNKFMNEAVRIARLGITEGHGGPFGSVIINSDGAIVGRGHNQVIKKHDPTCHGEMEAIRDACANLGTHDLSGCVLFTTAYPCPMCLGAVKWANISRVYYGCTVEDTESIGFRDKQFYESDCMTLEELDRDSCLELFHFYKQSEHEIY